jgi:preprotein translocase subunit YajC
MLSGYFLIFLIIIISIALNVYFILNRKNLKEKIKEQEKIISALSKEKE